jgi:hypothetical protein
MTLFLGQVHGFIEVSIVISYNGAGEDDEPYRSKFPAACPLFARPVAYPTYHLVVSRLLGSGETLWFGVYLRAVGP